MMASASFGADAGKNCWNAAGTRHGVDPWLLYAIAQQESGLNSSALGRNADGSRDIGLMQINSSHLPTLARYGIQEKHLYDPCISVHVGAWILARNFQELGYNWMAVGAYNAASPKKRLVYAQRISDRLQQARKASK